MFHENKPPRGKPRGIVSRTRSASSKYRAASCGEYDPQGLNVEAIARNFRLKRCGYWSGASNRVHGLVADPALHFEVVRKAVGNKAMRYIYFYVALPIVCYNCKVTYGPTLNEFAAAAAKAGEKNVDLSTSPD